MRMGKKKQPTYRVVAADTRAPRNGRFIEIIGTYEPRQDPSVIKIDNERAVHWLRHGAQPTERVAKILKISGAWTDFTGEAIDAAVPAPATKKSAKQLAKEAEAAEAAAAPAVAEAPAETPAPVSDEAGDDKAGDDEAGDDQAGDDEAGDDEAGDDK
jgi:small subunit ribosomal protein S16